MALSIGIVGLPNVGKSTLFKALTKKQVPAENFPFCTIDPNVGVVEVPDSRLASLAAMSQSAKIIPTAIEFVDIAGLVAGAHRGEGLGNKFLHHIREVDAICHVVRHFHDEQIVHVSGNVDAGRDVEIIHLELALADLEVASKRLDTLQKAMKGNADNKEQLRLKILLERVVQRLEGGKPLRTLGLQEEEVNMLKTLNFLTLKPMLYVINVAEEELRSFSEKKDIINFPGMAASSIIPLCIRLEAELVDLSAEDARAYLHEVGVEFTGIERLIMAGYAILDLITFFTTGEKETRAWTIQRGATAPMAAGKIHSDFEKGFIVAETIAYEALLSCGSWQKARENGFVRTEGKEYIVQDGDVVVFRFHA